MKPRGRKRTSDTIPRLDKVAYLFQTLAWIGEGLSFDQLRLQLIELRKDLDRQSRKDLRPEARSRIKALNNPTPDTFWANAREVVRELIRLGMVARAPVPNTSLEFQAFRDRHYELTTEGYQFLKLGQQPESVWEFRDRFYCAMDAAHPYLRRLRWLLGEGDLYIPRFTRSHIPGEVGEWLKGPPEPLDELAARVTVEIAKETGQHLDPAEFKRTLTRTLEKTWERRSPTGEKKVVSRWVVKIVNEAIVQAVAHMKSLPIDFLAFRYAVSLLSDFHVCWETRALSGRAAGWTIWLTATGEPTNQGLDQFPAKLALREPVWIKRRTLDDRAIADQIVAAILNDPNKLGGFSLIHEIRAHVCHTLRVHGWFFNNVLREMLEGNIQHEEFQAHVDAGGADRLPPSAEPFFHHEKPYYLVTLVKGRSS